jgi:hypothetical protein
MLLTGMGAATTLSHATLLEYQKVVSEDIQSCASQMGCQPILFVGTGLSRRYFSAPNWEELLATLAKQCPLIDKEYAYYKQTLKAPEAIGKEFASAYQQWAWGAGRTHFPPEMFAPDVPGEAYIKYVIAKLFEDLTPKSLDDVIDATMRAEISALQEIRPHAIITTNYDRFLEVVFPDYQPVVGQNIIRGAQILTGEIFKIHGCMSDYPSLVFTQGDYDEFTRKKKYLSAKLLTYFSEHPLLFIGYSASDLNIKAILSDIDECLPSQSVSGSVIPNIYILEWRPEMPDGYSPPRDKVISIEDGRSVRIRAIEATDFSWVFQAFGANQPLNPISPKLLRALLSRSYDLVRRDIPRKLVDADFQMLEGAVKSDKAFAKLFGITTLNEGSANNAGFPHTGTDLAIRITGDEKAYWLTALKYVDRVSKELGVNIKESDNRYHCKTKTGRKSYAHKYSNELLDIITRMAKGEQYTLESI